MANTSTFPRPISPTVGLYETPMAEKSPITTPARSGLRPRNAKQAATTPHMLQKLSHCAVFQKSNWK